LRRRAEALIRAEATDPTLTPQAVAERLGISPGYLHRAMRGSGHTVQTLIRETRIAAGLHMLMDPGKSDLTIARIAYEAGFASHAAFTDAVRRRHGRTPREVRDRALRRGDVG
jgi:AraC-like DNA-binding protein